MTGVTMLEDAPLLAAGHCPVDRPVMRPVECLRTVEKQRPSGPSSPVWQHGTAGKSQPSESSGPRALILSSRAATLDRCNYIQCWQNEQHYLRVNPDCVSFPT